MFADEWNELARVKKARAELAAPPVNQFQVLMQQVAYGYHQAPTIIELIQEWRRDMRRRRGNQDCLVRCRLRVAFRPVAEDHFHAVVPQPLEPFARRLDEKRIALDRPDAGAEPSQNGRLIATARPDLQRFVAGEDSRRGAHRRDDVGLGNRLRLADGQRAVVVGRAQMSGRNKLVPGNGKHGIQNPFVSNASTPNLVLHHGAAFGLEGEVFLSRSGGGLGRHGYLNFPYRTNARISAYCEHYRSKGTLPAAFLRSWPRPAFPPRTNPDTLWQPESIMAMLHLTRAPRTIWESHGTALSADC